MMKTIQIFFAILLFGALPLVASAQGLDNSDFERRLSLAKQMQDINPARDQINTAIDRYVANIPINEQATYRAALQKILNYRALEKISVDAYADTFTEEELASMVEYNLKPEARSAAKKSNQYAEKVYPEIIRMLDKALMSIKAGNRAP